MLRTSCLLSALYLAVPLMSVAKETKKDSYARIDLHPNCYDQMINNLVQNCGFETGNFSGWLQTGNLENTAVTGDAAHSGNFGATFGPPTLGYIEQVITTNPGRTYRLSFWLRAQAQPNELQVLWDTTVLADLRNVGDTVYTQFTYDNLTVNTVTTQLKFGFANVSGFFYIDDIVVEEH